ncbi:MAG: DUF4330 domain-containing protein [Clostridia bacterium]|nr:DUF4330 domain-containing protein [Clostridia bacterium]
MKIIDEKGRLFKLVNVVDLLVILAIVLVVGGVFYALSNSGAITVTPKEYYVATIQCKEVTPSVFDSLNIDDKIVYSNTYVNGTILSKSVQPSKVEVLTDDNQLILVDHPSLVDVFVELVVEVEKGSDFIMLGKYQVNIGKELVVKTRRVEVNGLVLSIKEYTK